MFWDLIGKEESITPFKSVVINTDNYENQEGFNLDLVGNINKIIF